MNKLELKHIVGYLPYNLQIIDVETNEIDTIKNLGLVGSRLEYGKLMFLLHGKYFKSILRPMSDLHKEIDGKIHLIELYAIASLGVYDNNFTISKDGLLDDRTNMVRIRWAKDINKLYIENYYQGRNSLYTVSLEIIEYLYKNHFDIHNLIGQGLAIDINSI